MGEAAPELRGDALSASADILTGNLRLIEGDMTELSLETYDPRADRRYQMLVQTGLIATRSEADLTPAPTPLTHQRIKEILKSKNSRSTPQERRAELIAYAETAEAPSLSESTQTTIFSRLTPKEIERLLIDNDVVIFKALRGEFPLADIEESYEDSTAVLHNLKRVDKMTGRLEHDVAYAICAVRLALTGEIVPREH